MDEKRLREAVLASRLFQERAEALLLAVERHGSIYSERRLSGATRRASMELTVALSNLRKYQ